MSTGWELLLESCVSARASAIADHTPSGDGVALLYQVAADEVRNGRGVVFVSAVNDAPHHLAVLKKMGVPLDVIRDKLRLVLPVPALPPLAGAEPSPPSRVEEDAELFSGVRVFARGWLASGCGGSSVLGDRLLTLVRSLGGELGCGTPAAAGKAAGAGSASTPAAAAAAPVAPTTVTILVDDASALAAVCASDARAGLQAVRRLFALASHADAAAAGMLAGLAAAAATHSSSVYALPVARPGAAAAASEAADSELASARSPAASASDAASGGSASLAVPRLAGGLTAPSAAAGALSARRASLSSSSSASLLGGSSPAVSSAAGEAAAPSSARSSARPSPSAGLAVSSRGTSTGAAGAAGAAVVASAGVRSRPGSARSSPAASASPPKPPTHGRSISSGSGASVAFTGSGSSGVAAAVAVAGGSGFELRPTGVYFRGSLAATVRCIVRLPMDADVAVGETSSGFCRVAQLRYLQSLCDAVATFACLPSGHSKDVHGRVTVTRRPVSYTCSADVSSNGGTGSSFSGMLPVAALPASLSAPGALATHAWVVAPPLSSLYRIADSSCRLQAVGECSFV